MAAVIPNATEQAILERLLQYGQRVRLYSNNVTPAETSTPASFTEVAGGGYEQQFINVDDWVYTQGDPTQAEAPQMDWEFTGATDAPGTVYGYYITDLVTGDLIAAERFAGAIVPLTPIEGSVISLIPIVQAS